MSAPDTLAALHLAVNEAEKRKAALTRKIDDECRAAAAAVRATYSDEIRVAYEALSAAKSARDAHINETASHPWEGKKVYRMASVGRGYRPQKERVEGIVEVRRKDTVLPANGSWRLPELGQAFVRKLKKDGKPGVAIDTWAMVENWTLCEDEARAMLSHHQQGEG